MRGQIVGNHTVCGVSVEYQSDWNYNLEDKHEESSTISIKQSVTNQRLSEQELYLADHSKDFDQDSLVMVSVQTAG